ncbi:hypothetical protein AK830_g6846 [Neonectria ditissima]|uniref:Uncharacterized protein n=1 Tax=Neonectria ditissima TaxID=78410 RepID=A0A0P7BBE5_9HYPO|nr:hypothetical protein AK830_g6846 [Neonectria ditissima]
MDPSIINHRPHLLQPRSSTTYPMSRSSPSPHLSRFTLHSPLLCIVTFVFNPPFSFSFFSSQLVLRIPSSTLTLTRSHLTFAPTPIACPLTSSPLLDTCRDIKAHARSNAGDSSFKLQLPAPASSSSFQLQSQPTQPSQALRHTGLMGNTPSSEGSPPPQKLSKPRQLALITGLSDATDGSESQHGRFSNSYLAGSAPISPTQTSPTDPTDFGIGIALAGDELDNGMAPIARSSTRRDSRRWSVVSRTQSLQSEHSKPRSSIVGSSSRPDSLVGDGGPLPLARTESLQSLGQRGSSNFNVRNYEAQRSMTLDRDVIAEFPEMVMESHSPASEVTETTWKSSNPAHPSSAPITRSNSDVSAYMPTRRRSIIQTPGVATRAHRSGPPSARSSFRNSLPSTPNHTRHNSIESEVERTSSAPPAQSVSQPPERVVTPCEADYQQLGGMKFGSLRIINGSPGRSPRPDSTIEAERELAPGRPTFRTSYSGREAASFDTVTDPNKSPRKRLFKILDPSEAIAEGTGELGICEETPSSENGDGLVYVTVETLDIRDDPSAKPTAERIRLELERKTIKNLSRSDSGFISSPSSECSRMAASKADSGYSSNVSLRSLRSLRSAVTDVGRKSPEKAQDNASEHLRMEKAELRRPALSTSNTSPPAQVKTQKQTGRRATLPSIPPDHALPVKSPSRRSLPSLNRGAQSWILSLRTSPSREFQVLRSRPRSSPDDQDPHPVVENPDDLPDLPSLQDTSGTANGSRLQRLLSVSHRKGPPKVRNNRMADSRTPPSPSRALHSTPGTDAGGSRLQELRDEKSKETLRTIMSAGSTDVLQSASGCQGSNTHDGVKQDTAERPTQPPRRRSFREATQSFAQAATALLGSTKTPSTKVAKAPEEEPSRRRTEPVDNTHTQRNNKSGPPDSTAKRGTTKPKAREPRNNNQLVPVVARGSVQTSLAPVPYNVKKTKSPPPVSMQTRSGKQQRGQSTVKHRSPSTELATPRRLSVPRDPRRGLIHSYPPAQVAPTFYGQPFDNRVMSMSPQHMTALSGHQQMVWNVGPNQRLSPLPIAHAGQQQVIAMPTRQGQQRSQTRARSRTTASQQNPGHMPPRMQSIHDGNQLGQKWLQHYSPQANVQTHGMDAMMYQQYQQYQQFDQNFSPTPQQTQSRHRRAISQGAMNGPNPPFRVLHSYNSPAYRGVPIWG